tara:strand:+ start:1260 stop:2291 length:1032 start_codon:yes stop_codon:yes gene_type:complete
MKTGLTYQDVLLVPHYSDIRSRSEVNIGNRLNRVDYSVPIISAPMDTVTGDLMANTMADLGGLGIIHRYNSIGEQLNLVKESLRKTPPGTLNRVGAAIGVTGDYYERAHELINMGVSIICLDIAHAHHILTKEALSKLKGGFPHVHFMVGNVATAQAFEDLARWGADSIKVGIGGGSICSTRIKTGHGVPNLEAILECSRVKDVVPSTLLIADGGIKTSGDIVKALAAGADFVMLGSLLAGTDESPGKILKSEKGNVKVYQGMASSRAQLQWKGAVSSREGISTTIPYKGSVRDIIEDLTVGIRSGFSYSGARTLRELQDTAVLIRQTSSGMTESDTHILLRR